MLNFNRFKETGIDRLHFGFKEPLEIQEDKHEDGGVFQLLHEKMVESGDSIQRGWNKFNEIADDIYDNTVEPHKSYTFNGQL